MIFTDLIIGICLLLSAFFSGMEIAFVSANPIYLELEKQQNNLSSKLLQRITKNPSRFIATMLVGNNIALVVYGIFMGDRILQLFFPNTLLQTDELSLNIILVQTLISTGIILLTAEFLPKVLFRLFANRLMKLLIVPAGLFYWIFSPLSAFIMGLTDGLLKYLFKVESDTLQLNFSKVELGNYIEEQIESSADKENIDSEIHLFQNALEFSDVKARAVMVPRAELTAVAIDTPLKDLQDLFVSTGYSKIPVYQKTVDDIVGYVHAFELFRKPKSLRSVLLPVTFVPEPMPANEVLKRLTKQRKSLAVVLDEYGGTAGIITVEDIIEELFGEIEDEHDHIAHHEKQLSENVFEFSARLEVDYLNQTYDLQLPESDHYETLGGLVAYRTGEIMEVGSQLELEQCQLEILSVSSTKIERIKLEKTDLS
ncbi:MAG: hemolysin family protein [Flavobacteriaceae bacterium]